MALTPSSPLAGGRLAHSWGTVTPRVEIDEVSKWVWDSTNDLDKVVIDNLERLAKERGIPMAQMSLAWMLSKPYITAPIVGTTAVQHVEDAVAALDVELSDDEIQELENPYVTHPVLGMM
ncbi:aldo/keto reductase [Streptomyces sp. NPDC001027]|uniref:aldo/keto reductase n=1 Tax=Streptomyces sp. NPDC001027 TaxID=3154771 RepID=UPI00331C06DF